MPEIISSTPRLDSVRKLVVAEADIWAQLTGQLANLPIEDPRRACGENKVVPAEDNLTARSGGLFVVCNSPSITRLPKAFGTGIAALDWQMGNPYFIDMPELDLEAMLKVVLKIDPVAFCAQSAMNRVIELTRGLNHATLAA